jgi:AraC-like DNA-binding protein
MMHSDYTTWPAEVSDLITVGKYVCTSPIGTHRHDFIEIVFIARGSCRHRYLDSEVVLMPGDCYVVMPHEVHAYDIASETVIYNCLFYPQGLGEDWNRLNRLKPLFDLLMVEPFYRTESRQQQILRLEPAEAGAVEDLLEKMIHEQQTKPEGVDIMQKARLMIFLTSLARNWDSQNLPASRSFRGKRELLAKAFEYIEQNLTNELKVEQLAAAAFLSPHHFRRLFKEVSGMSPIEYINHLRISRARELLQDEKLSITQLAEWVGINDINYFSRLFRSLAGITPSEYRKKHDLS